MKLLKEDLDAFIDFVSAYCGVEDLQRYDGNNRQRELARWFSCNYFWRIHSQADEKCITLEAESSNAEHTKEVTEAWTGYLNDEKQRSSSNSTDGE